MDIRIKDEKTIQIIKSYKGSKSWVNTHLAVVEMLVEAYPKHLDQIESLENELQLLKNRFEVLSSSMSVLGINPDFDQIDNDYAEAKRRHYRNFSY